MLGHGVTRDGISTDPEQVRAIKEWPVPEDESQLKAFLGTASYYRRFVPWESINSTEQDEDGVLINSVNRKDKSSPEARSCSVAGAGLA